MRWILPLAAAFLLTLPASAQTPRSLEITGLVVDGRGDPVEGAKVTLSPGGHDAETDDKGAFVLRELATGTYELTADLPPHALKPARQTLTLGAKPIRGVLLRLALGATLVGRVIGADDELESVRIVAWKDENVVRTQPNGAGDFRLAGLPPGRWRLAAQLPGGRLLLDEVMAAAWPPPTLIDLIFGQGRALRGRVFQGRGNVVDARVELKHLATGIEAKVETDELGLYQLPDLPAGVYRLSLHVEGRERHAEELELREDDRDLDLEIGDAELRGTVVDWRGLPVPGAEIELLRRDQPAGTPRRLVTDGAGVFSAEWLADGAWRLGVRHPHYLPKFSEIQLENGQRAELLVELLRPEGHRDP